MDVAKRLKQVRQMNDLSQAQMGEILGLNQAYISGLETGKETITDRLIKQVASQFHVREEWLRDGQYPMTPSMEELMAPVLAAVQAQGQPAKLILQTVLAKARLYDAEFSPAAAATEDLELFAMIGYLRSVWTSGDPDLKTWLKIQFRKAFPDFQVFMTTSNYINHDGRDKSR